MFLKFATAAVALLCVLHVAKAFPGSLLNNQHILNDTELRCGGVHTNSSGKISYKDPGTILANERCSWVIAVKDAKGYNISVKTLGTPENFTGFGQELILTGVGYTDQIGVPPNLTVYKPASIGNVTVKESNIVVITFFTSDFIESYTGFTIQYTTVTTGDFPITNPVSTHHLFNSNTSDFKYPGDGRVGYDILELSAFIFNPMNSTYNSTCENHVRYERVNLQGDTCNDALYTFDFNATASLPERKWIYSNRICGNETIVNLHNDDITMILFQSDIIQGPSFSGFHFGYNSTC